MKLYAQRLARCRVEEDGRDALQRGREGKAGRARVGPQASRHKRGAGKPGVCKTPGHERGRDGKARARKETSLLPVKRAISPAKLAANRRNAQRSTGPRTVEGKRRSAQNALKHGLCAAINPTSAAAPTGALAASSKAMSLSPVLGGECAATFETVRQELYDDFHPRTPIENWLVDNIANQMWKLMRAAGVERRLVEMEVEVECGREDDGTRWDGRGGRELVRGGGASRSPLKRAAPPGRAGGGSAREVLVRAFGAGDEAHPMMLLARYERGMQSMLLRLLTRLQMLQKRSNDSLYSREDRAAFAEAKRWSAYDNRWRNGGGWPEEEPAKANPATEAGAHDPTDAPPPADVERTHPNPPAARENPSPSFTSPDSHGGTTGAPDGTNPPPPTTANARPISNEPHNPPRGAPVKAGESVVQSGRSIESEM